MSLIVSHSCGCTTTTDHASGVYKSLKKCQYHVQWSKNFPRGESYYRTLGVMEEGACERLVAEMEAGIGPLPPPNRQGWKEEYTAVEIGCGLSPYVKWIQKAGYHYLGVEPDQWAARETSRRYDVPVLTSNFSPSHCEEEADLVLAAHVLEHLDDSPNCIKAIGKMLRSKGWAVILVPDGRDDMTNPDHLWFYTEETLSSCVHKAGLTVVSVKTSLVVKHERYIYLLAQKP